jgi:hypothetical protein
MKLLYIENNKWDLFSLTTHTAGYFGDASMWIFLCPLTIYLYLRFEIWD